MAKRKSSFGGWLVIGLLILGISQIVKTPENSVPARTPQPQPAASIPPNPSSPAPRTVEIRYVSATSLNMRREPSTSAAIISALPRGTSVNVIDRRNGWLLVSLSPAIHGWVSEQYTAATKPQPLYVAPAPTSQPTQSASGLSCSPRRTCSQIGSCRAAQWYLKNCSWGGRLDRDNDNRACETLC
ncbi:SH3 domain-containing protein [Devosia neptuniae]|uniref:SH3 domain-containing protein n=1 Tax=Devosia neptuniae TaxID=191302 RepID=UPI0036F2A228